MTYDIKHPAAQPKYVKKQPYVGDDGIYIPVNVYVPEGTETSYRLVMTKEMFVEAYNKWINDNASEVFNK